MNRFALRKPLWQDADRHPFHGLCKPDKEDPKKKKCMPEESTGATSIAARLYHAVGWFAPRDSVVYLRPSILKLKPGLKLADNSGVARPFDQGALDNVLGIASKRGDLVRMVASRWLPGRTLGPFRYEGTRDDDPNDAISHEDRRDLRGARVIAAWLNHFDSREQNTMDTWMAANPKEPDSSPGHIQHWYIDLDCFGSEWALDGISRRLGHAYYLDFEYVAADLVTFGLVPRPWDRAKRDPDAKIFGYFHSRWSHARRSRRARRRMARCASRCLTSPTTAALATTRSSRYTVVDICNGQARGPLRAHLYDLGPTRGFELVGLERRGDSDPPG